MSTTVTFVDYNNQQHSNDLILLLQEYAQDPMGGGKPLNQYTVDHLTQALATMPHAFSLLVYVDDKPAAMANCFEGFSTFLCKPLINIHDFMVSKHYRGQGISQELLNEIEGIARKKGCCKITLEVLEGNKIAQQTYKKYGFEGYELDPTTGKALFWEKPLDTL